MKKRTANNLHDAIDNALTPRHTDWTIHLPKHNQTGRKVNYYLILTHDLPEDYTHQPIIPSVVHTALERHNLTTNNLMQRIVHPDTDPDHGKEYEPEYVPGDSPHYEIIIYSHTSNVLPATGEEKRQEELAADIRKAIALPKSRSDTAENLAKHFQSVEEVLAASDEALEEITGVGPATRDAIHKHRSPSLASRLKNHDGDVLIVAQNEHGTYEPLYKPPDADKLNQNLIRDL